MYNPRFEKKQFKKEVESNVKNLFRKTVDEANPQQLFQAVSYAVKDVIIDDWLASQKVYEEEDPKMVYYMSMEFLMGRALGNNLINMTAYTEVKEALDGAGSRAWKWRPRASCGMLPGFSCNTWICGLWVRNPLPLWYV